MNTQEVPRFDHLWHEAIKWHSTMVKHANGIQTAVRLFRRSAYRFATAILLIQKHWHNEFAEFAINSGFDVTVWMDQHFETIEHLGDDRKTLLASIEKGMTEKEYTAQGRLWIVRRHLAAPSKTAHVDIDAKPATEHMTAEEERELLRTQNEALRSEVRQLRRDLAVAVQEVERLNKAVNKMQKVLNAVAKSNRKIG